MNKIITTHIVYRNKEIPVSQLKESSNLKIVVECEHGRRTVKWCRRNQLCKKCAIKNGSFNSSPKGRKITWGEKISEAKKGKTFSDEHKSKLLDARKKKFCDRAGIELKDFDSFPTKGTQYKLRTFIMNALRKNIFKTSIEDQDSILTEKLGYSIAELKKHLESKFEPNMDWSNYGEWHIDHITPESWFTYSSQDDAQFKKCWALDNLQPMWAKDNIKKNNKYTGKYRQPYFYMLCGQSGSGKTTLSEQLKELYTVISIDSINKKDLDKIIRNEWHKKPILIDISIHISTTFKRYIDKYEVRPVFLIESIDVVKANIAKRGKRDHNVESRYNRIVSLSKTIGIFSGKSKEVLEFLTNEQKTIRN